MILITFPGQPGSVSCETVSIVPALKLWGTWSIDIPPTGSTGNAVADRTVAEAFRILVDLPDTEARLRWIEDNVFRPAWTPQPASAPDLFRSTLMTWWLEIYEDSVAPAGVVQ
jgi:hypothetical protein